MTTAASGPDRALRGLVVLHRRLSALATAGGADPAGAGGDGGTAGSGADAVTRLLADELGAVAAVVGTGPDHEILAASAPGTDRDRASDVLAAEIAGPRAARVLAAAARGGRALRVPGPGTSVQVVVPVPVAHRTAAFVVAEEDPRRRRRDPDLDGDDVLLLAAEHAATIVGVLLGRDRVLAAAAGRVRDDLLSGLLLGSARSAAEASRWAQHVGLDVGAAHRVVVVAPRPDPPDPPDPAPPDGPHPALTVLSVLTAARERLERLLPAGAATVAREGEVVAIVPAPADAADLAARAARALPPDGRGAWPVTVALGREAATVVDLPRSYDQARRTVEAARRLGREGRLLRFDDLGVHRLLLQVPDPEDARAFAREVLGRLADDADPRTVELVRTLARYFREDGSPQRTAKALSVHPNTVGYRLRRAEELSGLVLEHYRDRLAAQVALEILGWME